MSKKRFLSIVLSAVMILSLACSALAVGQSGRYIGNSTVNGSIYQTYYQVNAYRWYVPRCMVMRFYYKVSNMFKKLK